MEQHSTPGFATLAAQQPYPVAYGHTEWGRLRPAISSDERVKTGRSPSHIHERQKAQEEAWLRSTLRQLTYERRRFIKHEVWLYHLGLVFDGRRGVPAWLYYHPEDIQAEECYHYKRVYKDPWCRRPVKIKFDLKIFQREGTLNAALDRPVSPMGQREVSFDDIPLPVGVSSWQEVQGEPSPKQGKKQKVVRAARCVVSRLAHTFVAVLVRDYAGYLIDSYNIKWPAKYRFTKSADQWTCQ